MRIIELLSTGPLTLTGAKATDAFTWRGARVSEDFLKLKPKLKLGAANKSLRDAPLSVGRQKSKRKFTPKTSG